MITPQSKSTIFGRYPNQQVISKLDIKYVLCGLTFNESAVVDINDGKYTINSFSLLLTDLKDITEEHLLMVSAVYGFKEDHYHEGKKHLIKLGKEIIKSMTKGFHTPRNPESIYVSQLLMLLGYACDQVVIENGKPITLSVADCVQNNVFKIKN